MKILKYALILTVLVSACTKSISEKAEDTIRVSAPESTKVHMNGLNTCWDKDDAVTVFYKTDIAERWTFKGNTGDRTGVIGHESISRKETGGYIYVMYPHDGDARLEGGVIGTTIPLEQQYRVDSYGTALMAARSDIDLVTLRYCTAMIELEYRGPAEISHIVLSGNCEESICGESSIAFDGDMPVLACTGGSSVRLNCNADLEEAETESFYFSIAPGTFEKGLTFMVHFKDGSEQKVLVSEKVTVKAGHIYTVEAGSPELPYDYMVFHLLFSDGTTRHNPFTTEMTFTGGREVGPFYYELNGSNYPFYMFHKVRNETTNFRITNGGGLYIGGNEGDYITFPAIEGYRLANIGVSVNKNSDFHVVRTDTPEITVDGGICSDTQGGDFRMLYLTGTVEEVSYRMMLDNNSCFRSINLYYRK